MKAALVLLCAAVLACSGPEGDDAAGQGIDDLKMQFARIPAGSFAMGADSQKYADQSPVHRVTISRAFELQTTEVTQAQWTAVMGANPSEFQGNDLPVENVTWNDAQEFLRKLDERDPGKHYRLPTEAEWEYACRAGTTETRYGDVDAIAWYDTNSGAKTHAVGTKKPNAWGLYDTIGNVWELVSDWKDNYPAVPVTDPTGPAKGYYKVSRGGSWFDVRFAVTATFRASPSPTDHNHSLGFRVARDAESGE